MRLFLLLFTIFLSGCATTTYFAYDKNSINQLDVATLDCSSSIQIISVNGSKEINPYSGGGLWYKGCDIKIAPGPNKVTLQYFMSFSNGYSTFSTRSEPVTIQFEASPGQNYKASYTVTDNNYKFFIEEVSVASTEEN